MSTQKPPSAVRPTDPNASCTRIIIRNPNQTCPEGKYAQAIERYSAAIELRGAPTPVYLSNRAAAHIKSEAFGLAIADAAAAIRLDDAYIKAYYRRGSANVGLAKWKEALKDFKKVRGIACRCGHGAGSALVLRGHLPP